MACRRQSRKVEQQAIGGGDIRLESRGCSRSPDVPDFKAQGHLTSTL